MPPPLQCLRNGLLRRLRLVPRRKRPDPLHQIEAQPDPELVSLARGEPPSGFVLVKAVFGGVGGLADVERGQRAGLHLPFRHRTESIGTTNPEREA